MSEELPDYNPDGSANPKGDAAYWRARAERAEAALAAEMPSLQEIQQLLDRILELEKSEVELEVVIRELQAENAALKEQLRRIPTSERMPEQGARVRVWINGTESIAKYRARPRMWETINGLYYEGQEFDWVTHWQPLVEGEE